MAVSVHHLNVESSVHSQMFRLGFLEIPAHPHSSSGCWHSSFDCWLGHVGSLTATIVPSCVHEFFGNFSMGHEEDCAHEFVVCCWIMLGPVINPIHCRKKLPSNSIHQNVADKGEAQVGGLKHCKLQG